MDRELFEEYLRDESRCGPVPDGAFSGAAGGAACGDLSRLSLTVEGSSLRPSLAWSGTRHPPTAPSLDRPFLASNMRLRGFV